MMKRLAEIAEAEVGVTEVGGNNRGPKIREYQSATWLTPDAWPWCAAFVDWCVLKWAKELSPARVKGIHPVFGKLSLEAWRPRTAGAIDLENWGRSRGLMVLDESKAVKAGDIVTYDMGHCGIIVRDAPAIDRYITAVEGNTGSAGLRDSESGDGVWRKVRSRAMVKSFIRIPE